jgi:hypothetical protein
MRQLFISYARENKPDVEALFSPRALPRLLHRLLRDGPPSSAIAIGL